MAPKIAGCRVVTEIPDCRRASAVPPVATISIPNAARVAANVCSPTFSHTLTNARRTGTIPAMSGILFIMTCSISHLLGLREACRFEILSVSKERATCGRGCPQPFRVNHTDTPADYFQSSFSEQADGCGVDPMLFHHHACRPRFDRVIIFHRHRGLQDDRSTVRRLIGEGNCTP